MKNPLEKEFDFYLKNQDALVKEYKGKFIVIKGGRVLGAYDDFQTAIDSTTSANHELGTFLIQKCTPGSEDYTATFHSRVA